MFPNKLKKKEKRVKTALTVFQEKNPLLVWLYGRNPSFFRAALITMIVVAGYASLAWIGDAHIIDGHVMGLFEDYTHHVLVLCGLLVLFGGKKFQQFLEDIKLSDLEQGSKRGASWNTKAISLIWWGSLAFCTALYVFGQLVTPWVSEASFAAAWATLPRDNIVGWAAGCFSSLYFFLVVFSIALWLIFSCVLVVVPNLARAVRREHVQLDPLHPDGMGGQGSLMNFAFAVMLTYVSVIAYIIAFGFAFGSSTQFLALTSIYILLLPFVATAPFIRIYLALKGAKQNKMLELSQLHAHQLKTLINGGNADTETKLSLTEIDTLHQRYAAISTWPLSLRSAAVALPLAIPIIPRLLEFIVVEEGGNFTELFTRLF